MNTKRIGRIVGTIYSAHDIAQPYLHRDEVRIREGWYVAQKDVPANTPLTDTEHWEKVFTPSTHIDFITKQMIKDALLAASEKDPNKFLNEAGEFTSVESVSKESVLNVFNAPPEPERSGEMFLTQQGTWAFAAGRIKFVQLESFLDIKTQNKPFTQWAREAYEADKAGAAAMAARNQIRILHAMGQVQEDGTPIPKSEWPMTFKVELSHGYAPIEGNITIPAVACMFKGQGAFIRQKQFGVNGITYVDSVEHYPTCLMPIGGNNNDGVRTMCSSSYVGNFAVVGLFKDPGDGGNGLVTGHTPPIDVKLDTREEIEAAGFSYNAQGELPASTQASVNRLRWGSRGNPLTQNRFGAPIIHSNITTFTDVGADTHITAPKGTFSDPKECFLDDELDIPSVRWVRAFDANGLECARWANIGTKIKFGQTTYTRTGMVGINDVHRETTSKPISPIEDEDRVYHLPFDPLDPAVTTTTIVVPGGLPAQTVSVEVSYYNLERHLSCEGQMTPFLSGSYYTTARSQSNVYENIYCDDMPWNGVLLVDGAYNSYNMIICRRNKLDGFYAPAGYEDFMHNNFTSCAAVNNYGWSLYLREPYKGSTLAIGTLYWGDVEGDPEKALLLHKKVTYTASLNDFKNFDSYGNIGGSMYIGGDSNSIHCGGMEHHFDSNNVDPFPSVGGFTNMDFPKHEERKYTVDINPMRWTTLVAFAAQSRQNNIQITGTPTDSRRCSFGKFDFSQLTTLPDHNDPGFDPALITEPNFGGMVTKVYDKKVYDALTCNIYTHPRSDVLGSLVTVNSPAFAQLRISPYAENERVKSNSMGVASDYSELAIHYTKQRTVTMRPIVYPVTPADNFAGFDFNINYTSKDPDYPGVTKRVVCSADALGLIDQRNITVLDNYRWRRNLSGQTIAAGEMYKAVQFFADIGGVPADQITLDTLEAMQVTITPVYDAVNAVETGNSQSATQHAETPLPDHMVVLPPRFDRFVNGSGDVRIRVHLHILNTSATEYTFPATNQFHIFNVDFKSTDRNESL